MKIVRILLIWCGVLAIFSCKKESSKEATIESKSIVTPAEIVSIEELKPITNNLLQRIQKLEDLSTYAATITARTLKDTLSKTAGPFTIFAPLNSTLNTSMVNDSIAISAEDYIVLGAFNSIALVQNAKRNQGVFEMKTLRGKRLKILREGMLLYLKDQNDSIYKLGKTDLNAGNGIIHIIENDI